MSQFKNFLLAAAMAMPLSGIAQGYKIGDKATDFSLKNTDGKYVSLKNFGSAKGYIIVFTCNHCPYAKAYEDRIIALDAQFKDKGYPVIAINPNDPEVQKDDSFAAMQQRAKEKKFTFPYLLDEGQKIYPQYGAVRTPHVFILEKTKEGNIVRYIGAIDDNYKNPQEVSQKYVEEALQALLMGKSIPTTETKAIGCSIKVKN